VDILASGRGTNTSSASSFSTGVSGFEVKELGLQFTFSIILGSHSATLEHQLSQILVVYPFLLTLQSWRDSNCIQCSDLSIQSAPLLAPLSNIHMLGSVGSTPDQVMVAEKEIQKAKTPKTRVQTPLPT
jgi:hypothetical protein